ncbi:MAG: hypothetical protein JST68_09145 [Bacteroidetes bacterium]|nr:hypothetical protein [Bacteroidota bacterium]
MQYSDPQPLSGFDTNTVRPRIVPISIGGGLLLMAFFTMMWTGIAQGGLQGADHRIQLIVNAAISLLFIIAGIRILSLAKYYPKFTTTEDQIRGKKMGKTFGIVFGIEGAAIPIACAILGATGHSEYILPAIALIVGLHFYPMARIFDRTVDYYIATWTSLVALTAIFIIIKYDYSFPCIMAILGIGVSLATIAYGIVMLATARKLRLFTAEKARLSKG